MGWYTSSMPKPDKSRDKSVFPKDFLWGASTASHQVEGGTKTDWDLWETRSTDHLVKHAHRMLALTKGWHEIERQSKDPENYIAGPAVDHYQRYEEDFQILKELNMNAYRFSIAWSRIEPERGKWDEKAIAHYRTYIRKLKSMGIEPFMTLWHFTMPQWFADMGAFEYEENIKYFERYVAKVAEEFGGEVRFISPLNEPNTYVMLSYILGWWPPQKHNLFLARRVYRNLMTAHKTAYGILKKADHQLQVGSTYSFSNDISRLPYVPGRLAQLISTYISNWWFPGNVMDTTDFIGLNYYFTNYYGWYGRWVNPKEPKNDLGWYMEPRGIAPVLKSVYKRYKKPIYITENGLADRHDTYRKWWIEETIAAMEDAIRSGVDLRGYLHWSLLDNFEWAFGWLAQFGLVHVDRATMKRTVRPSARWFGEEIKRLRQ
jgi:beta-glucosidase